MHCYLFDLAQIFFLFVLFILNFEFKMWQKMNFNCISWNSKHNHIISYKPYRYKYIYILIPIQQNHWAAMAFVHQYLHFTQKGTKKKQQNNTIIVHCDRKKNYQSIQTLLFQLFHYKLTINQQETICVDCRNVDNEGFVQITYKYFYSLSI